ncbi:hypothetical protein M0804_010076 [Polistes exclamans]|nr:hypothetical protein M0804_010076 [Polistes exclamans]
MQSIKDKYAARNLELRSLRSWFKHLPLINKSFNYDYQSEYYPSLCQQNQFNVGNIISNDNIGQKFTTLRTKLILRQFLESWKIYAIYKLRRRKTICEINHIYRVRLKRNVLNILSKNIIKCNEHYNKVMQRRYFRLWIRYTEIITMNRKLIKKYLQKCINIWKEFVLNRKEKNMLQNQLIDKVCKLYNSNLLHKYFIKLITIHNYTKICKEQFQMMACYYNKKVLNKSYFMWRAYCHAKVQTRYLKEKADQQYYRRLLKKCLKQFILYIYEVHVDKRKMEMSNIFYESKVLTKIFNAWIQWYHQFSRMCNIMNKRHKLKLLQKKELNERASCFFLNKYIMIWKLKCENNYTMYKKEELIISAVHKRIQVKYLVFWKKYINQKINKKRDIEYAKDINKKFLLQEGLKEILKYSLLTMQFHRENRIKNTTLKFVEDFEILSKYFDRWLSVVNLKEIKYTIIKENLTNHSHENVEENNASIIVPSFSLSSENCSNDIKFKYIDPVIPFNYIKNNSDEQDILFMNSTNNNLYSTPLCNDKSMSSLTNNVELLPPSAFY